MAVVISSLQNPLVKNVLLLLEKPKVRKEQNRIVIEGVRETSLALEVGFHLTDLIVCREIGNPETRDKMMNSILTGVRVTEVTPPVFNRMAYREDSGGIIALAVPKRLTFSDLKLSALPLILVLETVEKPGNLGAMLRTADAAGLDAVVICDPQTDIYNPNAIRSSVGCIFTMQVVTATTAETIAWMKKAGITTFATALTAISFYHKADFNQPAAIIMGAEATGLSRAWLDGADHQIKVPMRGKIDSMNVSATAAIVIFEALRQRN